MKIELLAEDEQGNFVSLDTYGNENIALTFQVDDARDISTKNASYSKDFNLPATKKNNQYFNHFYDVNRYNSDNNYNPNLNRGVILKVDDLIVIEGFLRLRDALEKQTEISYKVLIFNDVANLFDTLGDAKLSDLNFDDINHERSWGNVYASWYGVNPANEDVDYSYQLVNKEDIYVHQNLTHCYYGKHRNYKLSIRLKNIFDKIFALANFSYNSSFFESAEFKRFYTDAGIESAGVDNSPFTVKLEYPIGQAGWGNSDPILDEYPTVPGIPNCIQGASFDNVNINGNQWTWLLSTPPSDVVTNQANVELTYPAQLFIKSKLAVRHKSALGGTISMTANGVTLATANISPTNVFITEVLEFQASGFFDISTVEIRFESSVPFVQNNLQPDGQNWGNIGVLYTNNFTCPNYQDTFLQIYVSPTTPSGIVNGNLGDIKCVDFIKDILTFFNVVTSSSSDKVIQMEPYNSWSSNEEVDWSDKVDFNEKVIEVVDVPNFLNLKFAEDSDDYYHQKYAENNSVRYGDFQIPLNTDNFTTADLEMKVFAAPFIKTIEGTNITCQHIGTMDDDNTLKTFKNKPRIVYRWADGYNDSDNLAQANLDFYESNLFGNDVAWSPVGLRNVYSQMTHYNKDVENLSNTDYSYLFGYPNMSAVPNLPANPTQNMFIRFWREYIIEKVIGDDILILKMKAKLNPTDIMNLDFAKKYRIDKQLYRLNKVDYNTDKNKLSDIELIRI